MRTPSFPALCVALALTMPLAAAAEETGAGGDQLVVLGATGLATVVLPNGPLEGPPVPLAEPVAALEVLADGRLVGARREPAGSGSWRVAEIGADGSLSDLGFFAPGIVDLLDLAPGSDGSLYGLFTETGGPPTPAYLFRFLSGESPTLVELEVSGIERIARAPEGLWGLAGDRLLEIFPDSGVVRDVGPSPLGLAWSASTDSTGAIWASLDIHVTPPPPIVLRFDPVTGAVGAQIGALFDAPPLALAVRRRCLETATTRCLQGGRFRAEVDWQDFTGGSGPGRPTPARSADSALFYFFEPANWELMVKVLDGCLVDGHFWVFASASTTVAFELRVSDLETGSARTYTNPLGSPAVATTDTGAFPCH